MIPGNKRGVRFVPSEPLKPEEITINLRTPTCAVCGKPGFVTLSRAEFRALNDGVLSVQEALPDRSPEFREQVITGTHPECWPQEQKVGLS